MKIRNSPAKGQPKVFTQFLQLPIDTIKLNPRNARKHSKEQLAEIAASIAEFGFANPVLVDEDKVLIAGEGRLKAARALGLPLVSAVVIASLTDDQKLALGLADNKIALNAGWNIQILTKTLE